MTTSPTARMITDAVEASGKTLREIATEMGLERGNVISMLKSGEMRMPIETVQKAEALGYDSVFTAEAYGSDGSDGDCATGEATTLAARRG